MAMITPTIDPADTFGLGANFETQDATPTQTSEMAEWFTASGNYKGSNEHAKGDEYSQRAIYVAAVPSIDADLTLLATLGSVQNSAALVTDAAIRFVAGTRAEVTIDGHQHDSEAHTSGEDVFDCTKIIPAGSGLGVPTLITITGDASPVTADVRFSVTHIDKLGAAGGNFLAANVRCRCDISVDYEGLVTGATAGNWLEIKIETTKTNDDTPVSKLTAHQYVNKYVAPPP